MKSNRCKCGSKKERGVEKCIKCLSKELIQIKPSKVATEVFVDVIKDTPMAEIIKEESLKLEAEVKKKLIFECPVDKSAVKPKKKKKVVK